MRSLGSSLLFALLLLLAIHLLTAHAQTAAANDESRQTGRIRLPALYEVSGIAASRQNPDVLWMHNDGGTKHVYAVRTTGKIVSQVVLDVEVEDMEDIAIGPGPEKGIDYLYLADIGNNDAKRPQIRVIRLAEPALKSGQTQPSATGSQVFNLAYPDGPHDAEALLVDPRTGDLVIVTKSSDRTRVYMAPAASLNSEDVTALRLVATLDVGNVSAGDISRDGTWITLRREETGWLWNRASGESLVAALARKPQNIPVLGKKQAKNGESIAFDSAGKGYFTISEGRPSGIYYFALPPSAGRATQSTE